MRAIAKRDVYFICAGCGIACNKTICERGSRDDVGFNKGAYSKMRLRV